MSATKLSPRADDYLIKALLKLGFAIRVVTTDTHETLVVATTFKEAKDMLNDLDEAILEPCVGEESAGCYAVIMYEYGQAPNEIVSDWTDGGIVSELMDEYVNQFC